MLIFMLSHNAVYFEGGEAQLERLTLNAFSSSEICCNIFARDTFSSCSLIENVYMAGVLRVRACVCVCVCVRACVRACCVCVCVCGHASD